MARRNRRIPFGLLMGAILVLLVLGIGGALMRPAFEPDRIVKARFGDVIWNHEQHARMKDIANCQVCHHTERQGTIDPRPCGDCHQDASNADALVLADFHMDLPEVVYEGETGPPAMTAYHGKCVGCHRAMAAGPVGCRDCHAQSFTGEHGRVEWSHSTHARILDMRTPETGDNNCVRCHHQDLEATKDADYRPCDACHEPAEVQGLELATGIKKHETAKHFECGRCHTMTNPEEGLRSCQDCHAAWNVAGPAPEAGREALAAGGATAGVDAVTADGVTGDDPGVRPRPALEQAVHKLCRECHNRDYPELTASMPWRCADCHAPDPSVLADLGLGLILWDHDRHSKYGEAMTCSKCHHTDRADQPHMRCSGCHGTGLYENPPVADALRKRCLGCHEEKENGLVSWDHIATDRERVDRYEYALPDGRSFWWDHQEHAVAWSFSCRNCHHGPLRQDGEYVTGAKAEIAWSGEATHVQSCRKCHGEEGPVEGSAAHGTKAPGLHGVYTRVCLECHQRLGGGPQSWEDYFKIEPVREREERGA